jgi:hypothetical protein
MMIWKWFMRLINLIFLIKLKRTIVGVQRWLRIMKLSYLNTLYPIQSIPNEIKMNTNLMSSNVNRKHKNQNEWASGQGQKTRCKFIQVKMNVGKRARLFFKNIKRFSSLSHSIKNKIPNPDQKNNLQI